MGDENVLAVAVSSDSFFVAVHGSTHGTSAKRNPCIRKLREIIIACELEGRISVGGRSFFVFSDIHFLR